MAWRDNSLILHTHDLVRTPGAFKPIQFTAQAPQLMGFELMHVPAGSPIELDLSLQSVSEGILVTGTAHVQLAGECSRCLCEIQDEMTVDLQELYVYPESEATTEEDQVSQVVDDLIDLEPVITDQVVLELPFSPLCDPECAGLCPECGIDLNEDLDHTHGDQIDARWADLQKLNFGDANGPDAGKAGR